MRALVIAGTHSGVGKTTAVTGIIAALKKRGYSVQPFKAGPDYIDPSYHTRASGLPSRNLDPWLLESSTVIELFHRAMAGKDIGIVEGVMGLYDGARGEDDWGSTAHLARLLRLPVILVVDASAGTRSVGACVLGFKTFDPKLNLAGVILNGIASPKHLELVIPSLAEVGVRLLGYLPRSRELALPERHLGLIPTVEETLHEGFFERLAGQVAATIDLEGLTSVASEASPPGVKTGLWPENPLPIRTSLAVARDKAFSFYYPDSLELLESWGVEVTFFSPLADSKVPDQAAGIYIGGGFPEIYAEALSRNFSMRASLKKAVEAGMPVYAECGGLMYLCRTLEDQSGNGWPMADILPAHCSVKESRLTLGYRTVEALDDNLLMKAGESVKGHEFHLSALSGLPETARPAYRIVDQGGRTEGFRYKNVLASYVHVHLASKPGLAERVLEFCSKQSRVREGAGP